MIIFSVIFISAMFNNNNDNFFTIIFISSTGKGSFNHGNNEHTDEKGTISFYKAWKNKEKGKAWKKSNEDGKDLKGGNKQCRNNETVCR